MRGLRRRPRPLGTDQCDFGEASFSWLVITTKLDFSCRGTVFADDQLADANIEGVAHHGRLVVSESEFYRLRHALMGSGGGDPRLGATALAGWLFFLEGDEGAEVVEGVLFLDSGFGVGSWAHVTSEGEDGQTLKVETCCP